MSEPTERQVLYALVGGGFVVVVGILTIGAAVSGAAPVWWTGLLGVLIIAAALWMSAHWRRTALVIGAGIGLFVVWLVGTLIVAS